MLSEINNDTIAGMIKANPELEQLIGSITATQKQTASMFVHELRNPLALLKGTIQYIEMKHPEVSEFKYWGHKSECHTTYDRFAGVNPAQDGGETNRYSGS